MIKGGHWLNGIALLILGLATGIAEPLKENQGLVWYGTDDIIHRQWVDAYQYQDLRVALHKVQDEDRRRLRGLAEDYLHLEIRPVLNNLLDRASTFLNSMFDFGMSSSLLGVALSSASNAYASKGGNTPEAQAIVQAAIAEEIVNQFRSKLLDTDDTLQDIRSAMAKVLSQTQRDLLQDCDRYDQAFRDLVLASGSPLEILDARAGWQISLSWRPERATFRSLCAGLRPADLGTHLLESKMSVLFAKTEPPLRAVAYELAAPMAATALEVANYANGTAASLQRWGVPSGLADGTASAFSKVAYTKILARRIGERLDIRKNKQQVGLLFQRQIGELREGLGEILQKVCTDLIDSELAQIELELDARGEGTWSSPIP